MSKSGLTTIADVWNLVKEHVVPEDKTSLADQLVVLLMENDYDLADIRYEFSDDSDIIDAVKFYADENDEYDEDSDDFDDYQNYSDDYDDDE